MDAHALLALAVLAVIAWVDFRTHRIPNKILVLAPFLHLSLWWQSSWNRELAPVLGVKGFSLFLMIVIPALVIPRSSRFLQESIGMGDLKLIGYLLLFLAPYLEMATWLTWLSVVSLLTRLTLRSRTTAIPLAPILFLGSLFPAAIG
jgi:Flp pilus assembly protein protease CpaA